MFRDTEAFSGFSVNDLPTAKDFYSNTLGLNVAENDAGLELQIAGGHNILVYTKDNHIPATFTILNFPVKDIDTAVDGLTARGVRFDAFPEMGADAKGVFRGAAQDMGPNIAWFKDPAGNVLSVIEI